MRWKYVRNVLLRRFVSSDNINTIDYSNISTQVTIRNQKRPDIVIENNSLVIFIENKIYTSTQLQSSQCSDYYNELQNKKQKVKNMVFLVPSEYIHESEISEKSKHFANISTSIVYWKDVMGDIMMEDIYEANIGVKENIDFILNALSLTTVVKIFKIMEAMFMFDSFTIKSITGLILKTEKYTNEVMDRIKQKYKDKYGLVSTKYEFNENNIGTWIIPKNNQVWVIFLGYNFLVEDPSYLFNLRVHTSIINKEKIKINIHKSIISSDNEWYMFHIPKEILANEINVPDALYLCVDKVIEEFC